MQRAQLSQISAGTCSYALPCTLDGLLQPVLRHSASSSCRRAFSSNFYVAMAEQLCSNPWGTALFKANLGPPLKNEAKTTKIWGWGYLIVQINHRPGSHRFHMNVAISLGV